MIDIKETYEIGNIIEIINMDDNFEYMIGQCGYIQEIYNDYLYVMIPHCGYFKLKYDQVKKIKKIESKNYDMVELKQDAGNKFDGNKLRLDLLSLPAIEGTAEILTFGAKKYGDRNWEKGISWSRCFGALLRHLFAFWKGKDIDAESNKKHIHHASCCIMFLQHYSENKKYKKFDDRPKN